MASSQHVGATAAVTILFIMLVEQCFLNIGTVFRTVLYRTVVSFIFILLRTVLYWTVFNGTICTDTEL